MPTAAQREAVRHAYQLRCGYCGVHEHEVGSELEIDHHRPLSKGGGDEDANLVYACTACNKSKGDFWAEPGAPRRILHPHQDAVDEHLCELTDGLVQPLSPVGAFHIQRLRLNRPPLVALRQERQRSRQSTARLADLEASLDRHRQEVASLEGQLDVLLKLINALAGE